MIKNIWKEHKLLIVYSFVLLVVILWSVFSIRRTKNDYERQLQELREELKQTETPIVWQENPDLEDLYMEMGRLKGRIEKNISITKSNYDKIQSVGKNIDLLHEEIKNVKHLDGDELYDALTEILKRTPTKVDGASPDQER